MDMSIRTAWCARCQSPQECDERGCIACATLREKYGRPSRRKPSTKPLAVRRMFAEYARERRARLAAAGLCINSPLHGSPVPGRTKCARCIEVHRRTA